MLWGYRAVDDRMPFGMIRVNLHYLSYLRTHAKENNRIFWFKSIPCAKIASNTLYIHVLKLIVICCGLSDNVCS